MSKDFHSKYKAQERLTIICLVLTFVLSMMSKLDIGGIWPGFVGFCLLLVAVCSMVKEAILKTVCDLIDTYNLRPPLPPSFADSLMPKCPVCGSSKRFGSSAE